MLPGSDTRPDRSLPQRPARSFTVPEPPSLVAPDRTAARAQRRESLRDRIMAEMLSECTFRRAIFLSAIPPFFFTFITRPRGWARP